MAESWLSHFKGDCKSQRDTMRQSLAMFESGTMKLYHNRVDVSESHMAFLRTAIADMDRLIARMESESDA